MKKIGLILLISGFCLLVSGFYTNTHAQQETLTLLTYYPAPYGVYQKLDIMSGSWDKIDLVTTGSTYEIRIGSDNNAMNITANARWTGSAWTRDSTTSPSLAYLQHIGNSQHEFRVRNAGDPTSPFWTTAMVIETDGQVGIGTTNPTNKLHVVGRNDAIDDVVFMPGDDTADAGTPSIRVGIGTTSPTGILHARRNYNGPTQIYIENTNTGSNSSEGIRFNNEAGSYAGIILWDDDNAYSQQMNIFNNRTNGKITFHTGSIEQVRIANNGNVGIGEDNPNYPLHVNGGANTAIYGNSSQNHGIYGRTGAIDKAGVYGYSPGNGDGVWGKSVGDNGVRGDSTNDSGVYGKSDNSYGVSGYSVNSYGVYGDTGVAGGSAGYFEGRITATEEKTLGLPSHEGHVYDIAELIPCAKDVEPGDVVVINPNKDREVIKCYKELDPTIAGVISDKPQFSLGDREKAREKEPKKNWNFLALAGQVYVKADATFEEIKRGDLLTTSPTPGHAMKAKPVSEINGYPIYPQGCIIGKALEPLKEDQGKILVLIYSM